MEGRYLITDDQLSMLLVNESRKRSRMTLMEKIFDEQHLLESKNTIEIDLDVMRKALSPLIEEVDED